MTAAGLSTAAARMRRADQSRSVLVQKAHAASRDVAVVAEIQTEVAGTVYIASQADGVLQTCNKSINKYRTFIQCPYKTIEPIFTSQRFGQPQPSGRFLEC